MLYHLETDCSIYSVALPYLYPFAFNNTINMKIYDVLIQILSTDATFFAS